MDRQTLTNEVRSDLEAGQGCAAARLIVELSPQERLTVLRQAVAANQADQHHKTILQFSDPSLGDTPPGANHELVWLTASKDKDSKPIKLLGFQDLTILPCKNTGMASLF